MVIKCHYTVLQMICISKFSTLYGMLELGSHHQCLRGQQISTEISMVYLPFLFHDEHFNRHAHRKTYCSISVVILLYFSSVLPTTKKQSPKVPICCQCKSLLLLTVNQIIYFHGSYQINQYIVYSYITNITNQRLLSSTLLAVPDN